MKKILVMGAGGFIGKPLCLELSKNNLVRAFNNTDITDFKGVKNIEIILGDFTALDNFEEVLKDTDVVYHLISTTIPNNNTNSIPLEIEENIIPTVKLLECMVKVGVEEIVFASSGGTIYGETGDHKNCIMDPLKPICSYGVQKKVIEAYLEFYGIKYGINYKIARLSNPYGLGQDPSKPQGVIPIFVNRLLNGEEIKIFGDGSNERDYIYMDDLVEGLIKLGEYKGEEHIFNLGFGKTHTLKEIIQIIENLSGKKFVNVIFQPKRSFDVEKTILEVETSQNKLSWRPKIEMEQGIDIILNRLIGDI
jgi:UDP-glucose 4-epimerase